MYLLDDLRSSRIKSFQRFLVRSCQNELMRSNNFVVKVAGKKCSEVEPLPKNYYGCEQILQILSCGPQALKHKFFEPMTFWFRSFFGLFLTYHGSKNEPDPKKLL